MNKLMCIVVSAVILLAGGAIAAGTDGDANTGSAPPATPPAITFNPTLSSTLFTNFVYSPRGIDGKMAERFDFDRMYLTMKTPLAEDFKFQLTTDIYRNASATSYYNGLAVRLKFAMIDYAPAQDVSIKFGMIPGAWAGLIETYWKYRGVVTTSSDKYSLIATADAGVSVSYALPGKIGDFSAFMLNGTGYSAPEANRFKDYVARLTLAPFGSSDELKGLTIAGIAYIGSNGTNVALEKNRLGGFAGYTYSYFMVGTEYLILKNAPSNPDSIQSGSVFSLFAEVKSPLGGVASKFSVIGRIDVYDPNGSKGGDMTHFRVFGLVYKANDRVWWVIDNQKMWTEKPTQKAADGSFVDADVRWYLHAIINF